MKWPDGSWYLPEKTLGWQVLEWAAEVLLQPDGPESGQPWRWTDEQVRFILWWYAVDAKGNFVYRRGVLRRLKGWGKDPLAAALALIEFLGPCRFGGWDDQGEPIAIPHSMPWIQIAGVNQDATRNTMSLFPGFLGSKERAVRLGVDLGKTIIYGPNGGRIESVTSSPRALEGSRPSTVVIGESHHWLPSNEGREMGRAIARNLAKSRDGSARSLAITNAHEPGEDSLGEADYEAYLEIASGKSKATGFLYDSLEAPDDIKLGDRDSLVRGLKAARGDAVWLDVDRIVEEVMDPTTPPSMSLRFYANKTVANDDAYLSPAEWAACAVDDRLEYGEGIALFFDGSLSGDHTALVACRVEDGLLSVLGHYDPKDHNGEIDRDVVRDRVSEVFDAFDVQAFYADVRMFESEIDSWRDLYGSKLLVSASPASGKSHHPIAWDMRSPRRIAEFSAGVEKFLALALNGQIRHDGDLMLAQHMANARRAPNRHGFSLRKDSHGSNRKIDLAVAAVGASIARWDLMATGKKRRKKGRAFSF